MVVFLWNPQQNKIDVMSMGSASVVVLSKATNYLTASFKIKHLILKINNLGNIYGCKNSNLYDTADFKYFEYWNQDAFYCESKSCYGISIRYNDNATKTV